MKYEILYNSFLEEITQKIPQRTGLVNTLADMLCIGKEAVYRRLRREVPFTLYEAMTISRQLGISLDSLKMDELSTSKPFQLRLIEYINPAESDFALLEEMNVILKSLKDTPDAKGCEVTNILPQPLYIAYEHLFKFYLFKWRYLSNRSSKAIPYKDIIIENRLKKFQEENVVLAKHLHTEYIFDNLLFYYLATNIKYYYRIDLITSKEVQLIKLDLLKILDQIDSWSRTGFFKETGKKINIYVSNVNVDTNYIYMDMPGHQLTIIKAFLINGIASTDKRTFEELKHWIRSMKRQSILISGSSEIERVNFLEEQHKIIESLSQL